jgi:hypothetical protein
MIKRGADPTIADWRGNNAVDKALQWHKYELVEIYMRFGYEPSTQTNHDYYMALKQNTPKSERDMKRFERYEKYRAWVPKLYIPISVNGLVGRDYQGLSIQTGILLWNDDYFLAMSTVRLLAGPFIQFNNPKRVGIDINLSYQRTIFDVGISSKVDPKAPHTFWIEPHAGLSLGPILSMGYARRIHFDSNDSVKHLFYARLTLFHQSVAIEQKKKSDYMWRNHSTRY